MSAAVAASSSASSSRAVGGVARDVGPTPKRPNFHKQRSPEQAAGGGGNDGSGSISVPVLERRLTLLDLVLLGIGASIGSGIFVVTGIAAKQAGPSVVLSFAVAGLASVLDALCYAELAARFPGLVGGAYLYTYAAFGELAAFLLFCHLMFDYHIGAASIARSLASYLASLVQSVFGIALPPLLAPGGLPLLGAALSVNLVAPLLLLGITWLLCRGVRESAAVNNTLTSLKIGIVLLVVLVGACFVQPSNWVPFAPNGAQAVLATASVVFFSYIGFDAVANTAEEAKQPHRDVPLGILISLSVCALLYVGVCLVLTGMVPYSALDPAAPLSAAFAARGLRGMEALIDVGAIAGLTTTLVAGMYVQSRLYVAIARDGLLPSLLAKIHVSPREQPGSGTGEADSENSGPGEAEVHAVPLNAQLWVGAVAGTLALLFDVSRLSHVLSVGVLLSYSLVCVCVPILRLDAAAVPGALVSIVASGEGSGMGRSTMGARPDSAATTKPGGEATLPLSAAKAQTLSAASPQLPSLHAIPLPALTPSLAAAAKVRRQRAVSVFALLACLALLLGLAVRFSAVPFLPAFLLFLLAAAASQLLFLAEHSRAPHGFNCPWVPWLPALGMLVNVYLVSQMHPAAWLRLVLITAAAFACFGAFERGQPRHRSAVCSATACSLAPPSIRLLDEPAAADGATRLGAGRPPGAGATEEDPLLAGKT